MKLDINYRKKTVKNTNTWRLNNTLLNNQEITEDIKEEIKKYLETNDNENTMIQNLLELLLVHPIGFGSSCFHCHLSLGIF